MSEKLIFRKAQKEDLPRVSEFRKTFFPYDSSIRSYEPEYYAWKCYDNPVQQGEIWLAEDGVAIAGTLGISPKRMKVLGNIVDVVERVDGFTRSDYQRRGIFTALGNAVRKSALDKGISLIYGTPNKNSLPGAKKVNQAQVAIQIRNLVKPINVKRILETKLKSRLLAVLFSPIVSIASSAASMIGTAGSAKDVTISQVSSFPDDIDIFWERASQSYDIALVRNKDYLQWRYIQNPDRYSIFIATDKDETTVGYMVTKIGSTKNATQGFIADFLTFEGDHRVFKKLLIAALQDFRRKKVNVIYVWVIKGGFYSKILSRAGFWSYEHIPLTSYENELGIKIISQTYKWHFTMGDTDNI